MKSRKIKPWVAAAIACLLLLCLIGAYMLGRGSTASAPYRIIYIPKIQDSANDFWTSLLEGAQMAADEYNVELAINAPDSEDDYETQIELVSKAIEEHPDVIMFSPASYTEEIDIARRVKDAGIKLVMVDSFMEERLEETAITTDNIKAGQKLGEYMKDKMAEKPVIGVMAHVKGSSTAIEREEGLRQGLGEYSENIVDVRFCDSDYDKAYNLTREMLTEHPDINMIFGLNEYSAVGAARAVKDLGKSGQINMAGFDNSLEEIQYLESGLFSAIVIQKPFVMGYLGIEKAVQLLNGTSVPEKVDSGSELITKENMYTEENQKLLFPFWNRQDE